MDLENDAAIQHDLAEAFNGKPIHVSADEGQRLMREKYAHLVSARLTALLKENDALLKQLTRDLAATRLRLNEYEYLRRSNN
jgi:hypothetical protein